VFVDTPGLHKPVTALGKRVNATALESAEDVDVVCLVIDATMPFGKGDQWVADRIDISKAVLILNKVDAASKQAVLKQLVRSSGLDAAAYFPVSALSGEGIPELIDYLLASPVGYWFDRQDNLAVRVKPIQAENDGGLPVSELIARGWLHD
jgi:GTP-binding protein Era